MAMGEEKDAAVARPSAEPGVPVPEKVDTRSKSSEVGEAGEGSRVRKRSRGKGRIVYKLDALFYLGRGIWLVLILCVSLLAQSDDKLPILERNATD